MSDEGQNDAPFPRPHAEAPPRILTLEEGLELLRRFIAGDNSVNAELSANLNRLLYRVHGQRWSGGDILFVDARGDCFDLLARWREEGSLTVEPLPHLAQRLMKQSARRLGRQKKKDRKLVSLDEGWNEPGDKKAARFRQRLEELISGVVRARKPGWRQAWASLPLPTPELSVLAVELYDWVMGARERLSESDRQTFDGSLLFASPSAKSLHAALGCTDATARKRRERLREAIVALAKADGMDEAIARWRGGRTPRKDLKKEGT